MAAKVERRFVDEEYVAEMTGFPRQTLSNWRHKQMGPPYVKFGRAVKYDLAALEKWIERNTVATTQAD